MFLKGTSEKVTITYVDVESSLNRVQYNTIQCSLFCNGNRTEWSPIRSVIIRAITKSDDRATGVLFVYHEYDYRPNWTPLSPITN